MTSLDETLPEDKEKEPVNDEVETNEEIQIENEEEEVKEDEPIQEIPTEFKEKPRKKQEFRNCLNVQNARKC